MAESLIPEVLPGLVQVRRKGADVKSGDRVLEKKGALKTVFPIDAKELLMSGDYELVENGAVEAARINANPLRSLGINPEITVAEVTGIAGQVHIATDEGEAEKLIKASDHGGKEVGEAPGGAVAAETRAEPAKAAGTPTGAKTPDEKK